MFFDAKRHINLPVQKRRVGYLFQDYALFPNMTVLQNILCGAGEKEKALEYVRRFYLEGLENLYPMPAFRRTEAENCHGEDAFRGAGDSDAG